MVDEFELNSNTHQDAKIKILLDTKCALPSHVSQDLRRSQDPDRARVLQHRQGCYGSIGTQDTHAVAAAEEG